MYNKEQAFKILASTIKGNLTHQDYERVKELAKKYKAMISGENIDDYLKQFNLREDTVLFEQRKRLTQVIVSCITGSLITPEKKIPSIKPLVEKYYYKTTGEAEAKTKKDKLDVFIKEFYGLHGINDYLSDHFMNLSDSDPNAFILFLFDSFDAKKETPKVYAENISSTDAIDFQYLNNVLQYLTIKKPIKYQVKKTETGKDPQFADGSYFTIWSGNDQIVFLQIDNETIKAELTPNLIYDESLDVVAVNQTTTNKIYYWRYDKNSLYKITFFEPKAKQVPALRVGNIPDTTTERRTVVNTWHRALPYLMKSIKAVSELDLTASLHAFPQKFMYQSRCAGVVVDKSHFKCDGGTLSDGQMCGSCGGTGWQKHDSAQDAISIALPRNPVDLFDLSKMVHYVQLPVELLDWMTKYIDALEPKAIKAVYNNDVINQSAVQVQTATQVNTQRQSVYDALSPLAKRYSYTKKFIVQQIANYNDLEKDLIIEHVFPNDFHFETVDELIAKIDSSRTAGVNDYVLDQMNTDLTNLVYVDQPEVLKKIDAKRLFNPFEGKSEGTILALISQNLCTKYDKILFSEFKSIFTELEQEAAKGEVSFYDLAYTEQKKRVDVKVQEYIEKIDEENQPAIDNTSQFFDNGNGAAKSVELPFNKKIISTVD